MNQTGSNSYLGSTSKISLDTESEGMNELATVHCGNTYNSHISHNSRGFSYFLSSKVEPVYTGVTAHRQKGTGTREACCTMITVLFYRNSSDDQEPQQVEKWRESLKMNKKCSPGEGWFW